MFTTVTRAVLATAAGLMLAAAVAPAALAQEDPTDLPQPSVVIRAVSVCAEDGTSDVEVILDDAMDPYTVALTGSGHEPQETVFDEEHQVHRTVFEDVEVGRYVVEVEGADNPSDGAPVTVKACEDGKPTDLELTVEVECRGGWGLATFQVANPDTGEVRNYSLSIENPTDYEITELAPGLFLRITENLFDDGTYTASLSGEALDEPITETFEVKCAPVNAPSVYSYARCDGKGDVTTPAVVYAVISNPNRHEVEYTVIAGDVTRRVAVASSWQETVDLGPFPGGDYPVTVVGSDGTETPTHVVVDHCEDVAIDDDGLQVAVRCVDGESVVTMRYYAVGPYPAKRTFKIQGLPEFDEVVEFTKDGPYQWTRYDNAFEDGTYTASLTGAGLTTVETFTVDCVEGTPTTTTAPPTTGTSVPATTTAPPPQGSRPPVDELPVTGAAVGGMVALGLAALGLGGGLVFAARRRRPTS